MFLAFPHAKHPAALARGKWKKKA